MLHHAIEGFEGPALYFQDETLSFADLRVHVEVVASVVEDLTPAGAAVAMIGDNHPSWIESYYGVPKAGRVLTFLNHRLAAAELASIIQRSGATALIGPDEEIQRLRPLAEEFPLVDTFLDRDSLSREVSLRSSSRNAKAKFSGQYPSTGAFPDSQPAWIIYTSGTTGPPKGVTLTHANLAASLEASAHGRPICDDEIFLYPFPLCHVSGYNVLRIHAASRPIVLLTKFSPNEFISLVKQHEVTSTTLPATMLSRLLDFIDDHREARAHLGSLRLIAYGASPMPPTLLRRAHQMLGVDFTQGYGMTELAGNAVFLSPADHQRGLTETSDEILSAAGRPGPNVSLRIVDDDMEDAPAGTQGEILIQGPQVMSGYWKDDASTKEAFTEGWFHTGDIGVFDTDGLLSIVDRKKDIIITGGENVSSREVEEEILRVCPELREVAVIAVSDPHWGENVCAIVVWREGEEIPDAELLRRVRKDLSGFKLPRHIVAVAELPRNVGGKVMKQQIRSWVSENPHLLGNRIT